MYCSFFTKETSIPLLWSTHLTSRTQQVLTIASRFGYFFVTMFYSSEKNSILLTRVFLIHTLSLLCPELRGLSLVRAFSRGFGHKKLLFRWGRHRRVQCRQRFVLRPNLSDRGLIYPFSVSDVYIHRSWCVPPNAWTVPLHRIHGLGGLLAMVTHTMNGVKRLKLF